MKIEFFIVSRGTLLVYCDDKKPEISGELTFKPPVFYANLNSIRNCKEPHENIGFTKEEKDEIVAFITKESSKIGSTKILFDQCL